jgi:CxxC motif-containing protein (DUF1111 family)
MHRFSVGIAALLFVSPIALRWLTWPTAELHELNPQMVSAGEELFEHEWTENDPLSPSGDGLGPVFNATSCVACHIQAAPGGGGPNKFNVVAFTVSDPETGDLKRSGVVHAAATSRLFKEELTDVDPTLPTRLPAQRTATSEAERAMPSCFTSGFVFPVGVNVSQRNTPALFGARLIDELPDSVIIAEARRQRLKWTLATDEVEHAPVGKVARDATGKVGKFGWKGQTASIADFVQGACANELGLGNPGANQPVSLAKNGADYKPPGLDLTQEQCDQMTQFVLDLAAPTEELGQVASQRNNRRAGREHFENIGCANCHTPDLGGIDGIYSDLLLHRMGQQLVGGGSYNDPVVPLPIPDFEADAPHPSEWRTPPLWGVADSAPYLHDGRSETLTDAITQHGGQALASTQRFAQLSVEEQNQLLEFLGSLKAPKIE